MKAVYTDNHHAHQPTHEIYEGRPVAYAETATRADNIIASIRRRGIAQIVAPHHFPDRHMYRVHRRNYINFLRNSAQAIEEGIDMFPSYFISDTYAPITRGTYSAARSAVDVALTGSDLVLNGDGVVYVLCRPPGHHASPHSMGGYCYFNNAAIAADYLSGHGRVAILDIDFHHGNGTQDVFYDRSDVLYVSIHANPKGNYPYISGFTNETGRGDGSGFNLNFPIDMSTNDSQYLKTLALALENIQSFAPDYLVVSVGFDTFVNDPIGGLKLTKNVYPKVSEMIAGLNLPTLLVQEGGYNVEHIGELATSFLATFAKR